MCQADLTCSQCQRWVFAPLTGRSSSLPQPRTLRELTAPSLPKHWLKECLLSSAVAAGWPCVILSDQLTVRIYSSSTAFEDNSIPVSPAASQPLVPSALPVAPSAQPQLVSLPPPSPLPLSLTLG